MPKIRFFHLKKPIHYESGKGGCVLISSLNEKSRALTYVRSTSITDK